MDGLADVWPQGCMKNCIHTRSNIEKVMLHATKLALSCQS